MTTPVPLAEDDYPRQWWPRERREREEKRTEMELAAGAMSDAEFAEFVKRARGDR